MFPNIRVKLADFGLDENRLPQLADDDEYQKRQTRRYQCHVCLDRISEEWDKRLQKQQEAPMEASTIMSFESRRNANCRSPICKTSKCSWAHRTTNALKLKMPVRKRR